MREELTEPRKIRKEDVFAVLEEDEKQRSASGKLFGLHDLKEGEWDCSLPTLVTSIKQGCGEKKKKTLKTAASDAEAFLRLARLFPAIEGIDRTNVLIAGGAAGHVVHEDSLYSGDCDLFIYGIVSEEEATKRAKRLVTDIIRKMYAIEFDSNTKRVAKFSWRIIRNANGITIFVGQKRYQVIFRAYRSVAEILHGFDLGSSAVGIDAHDKLHFTTLSLFAYSYMVNIVDTTRRSTTYESRIYKYFERGFDLVMPYFEMSELREDCLMGVVRLPTCEILYDSFAGNCICVTKFSPRAETEFTSDYELDDLDEGDLMHLNMKALMREDPHKFYVFRRGTILFSAEDKEDVQPPQKRQRSGTPCVEETVSAIFDSSLHLTEKFIEDYFDTQEKCALQNGVLRFGVLRELLEYEEVREVIRILSGEEDRRASNVLHYYMHNKKLDLISRLKRKFEGSEAHPVKWRMHNAGTQLTSSFNPIFEDAEKWYGRYYKNPRTFCLTHYPLFI